MKLKWHGNKQAQKEYWAALKAHPVKYKPKKKKHKAKRNRGPHIKQAARSALADVVRLEDLARDHELGLRVNEVRCPRGAKTYHFIFHDKFGKHVLHYWPGTGKTWQPGTGEKGIVEDCWAALDEAARVHSGLDQQYRETLQ